MLLVVLFAFNGWMIPINEVMEKVSEEIKNACWTCAIASEAYPNLRLLPCEKYRYKNDMFWPNEIEESELFESFVACSVMKRFLGEHVFSFVFRE